MNISKNYKTILYVILAILIVLGVGYAVFTNQQKQNNALNLSPSEVDQLPAAEKKRVLEVQLKDLELQEQNLSADASSSNKFTVYIQLAEVRTALGNHQGALDALGKISEDRKGNTRVWQTYAQVYKNMGDLANAKQSIKTALAIDNELPASWILFFELNQDIPSEELKANYIQAIAVTKSNVAIMVSYAKFNERIGDKATAVAAWETAINGNPEKEVEYRAEIARLRQ